MTRRTALVLLPIGPLCVGLLRFLLPYYTASDNVAAARSVAAHQGRESAVLWLGLVAALTLVPGIYLAARLLPATRLRTVALALVIPGYLCLPILLMEDVVLWTGAHLRLDPEVTGSMFGGIHPMYDVATGVFVVGHVLGTVLLGVAFLRSRRIPAPVSWGLIVSQPLHFVTTVFLGLAWVDLVAWSLTAIAMAAVAVALLDRSAPVTRSSDAEPALA
jgi:hypothetical protein